MPVPTHHLLRHTPLIDLLRGRLTGRLDWRGRIAAADLPPALAECVTSVVRRTRLWRTEKFAVAAELLAHFQDGLDAGESAEQLITDFGDIRTAAKLIRRAKCRQRSLVWQVWRWAARVLCVLAVIYGYFLAQFLIRQPHLSVDYIAKLNAPTLATPDADRAWPLYRRAIVALGLADHRKDKTLDPWLAGFRNERKIIDATPADPEWPTLTAWLDAHADGLALLRTAAAKPLFGFILGPAGSQTDPELDIQSRRTDVPLVEVLLPDLNHSRHFANLLAADARYAASAGDNTRVVADFQAILGIADQQAGRPFAVTALVRVGIYALAIDQIEQLLVEAPAALTDAQLVGLAHRIAIVGGDAAGSLCDTAGERLAFHDLAQRMYSDDGHGDGRLTLRGIGAIPGAGVLGFSVDDARLDDKTLQAAVTSAASVLGSRRDVVAEYDRLLDLVDKAFSRPLRDWPSGESPMLAYDRRFQVIKHSPLLAARYLPLMIMLPAMERLGWSAERLLGRRDGVIVGIGLELYRRHHGKYPTLLSELTPMLLPAVPADRIDGKPVRYRLIAGRPVIYSVGVDGDDDGGRPPRDQKGQPQSWLAAQWPSGAGNQIQRLAGMTESPASTPADGDWILFDGTSQSAR